MSYELHRRMAQINQAMADMNSGYGGGRPKGSKNKPKPTGATKKAPAKKAKKAPARKTKAKGNTNALKSTNPWIRHVAQYAKKYNISYGEAVHCAAPSYVKK